MKTSEDYMTTIRSQPHRMFSTAMEVDDSMKPAMQTYEKKIKEAGERADNAISLYLEEAKKSEEKTKALESAKLAAESADKT
ncbi:unnamed protein product, partial [Sphacelaria rigidula]